MLFLLLLYFSAGPAFQIDSELYLGHTFVSDTYENKPLNGLEKDDTFKCMKLEIYALE